MRFSFSSVLAVALAAESTIASSWWSGSAGKAGQYYLFSSRAPVPLDYHESGSFPTGPSWLSDRTALQPSTNASSQKLRPWTASYERVTRRVSDELTLSIAYNKWHETELERWLGDHNIPYPTPADRADLEKLVKSNWQDKVATPYNDWEPAQLQSYLGSKGQEAKKGTELNKDSLVNQVKGYWSDSVEYTSKSYDSVKDWIFDGSSFSCC